MTRFARVQDIPDVIDTDRPDLRAPRCENDELVTGITAVEQSYIFFSEHNRVPPIAGSMRLFVDEAEPEFTVSIVEQFRLNHISRAIFRVAIHPMRFDVFDLPVV